jgi:hypothetical protein
VSERDKTDTADPAASDARLDSAEPVPPDVSSDVSSDDRDEGWGEDPRDGRRDEQWYRSERPPHHE